MGQTRLGEQLKVSRTRSVRHGAVRVRGPVGVQARLGRTVAALSSGPIEYFGDEARAARLATCARPYFLTGDCWMEAGGMCESGRCSKRNSTTGS